MVTKKITKVSCTAPASVFGKDYNAIPKPIRAIIERQGCLPCDGSGRLGTWCSRCHWGKIDDGAPQFEEEP